MRVMEGLGTVRVAGRIPDQFSMVSERPYPFYSEGDLITQGKLTNLYAPWDNELWPGTVAPPPIPSEENEAARIHAGMRKITWPYAGTFSHNREDRVDLGQADFMDKPGVLYGVAGISAIIGAYGIIRGSSMLAGLGGVVFGYALSKVFKS